MHGEHSHFIVSSGKSDIDPVQAAHYKLEFNHKKYPADRARGKAEKFTEDG